MKDIYSQGIIDSHIHFWLYKKEKHSWLDDEKAFIRRDFLPEELKEVYIKNMVEGCIAVQADQTLAENDFLLYLAKEHTFIKGIVGWVDFQNKAANDQISLYKEEPLIKGFRHIVQEEADAKFLLRREFLRGIEYLENTNYVYEILVFPHQLPMVYEFVNKFSNIQFVLDHIAKPYIKEGYIRGWAKMIQALGEFDNLSCKISGLVTETDYKNWSSQQLMPYFDVVLQAFGPKRLIYGSDWPVCLVSASYSEVLSIAKIFAEQLSDSEQQLFFHKNAERIYKLN